MGETALFGVYLDALVLECELVPIDFCPIAVGTIGFDIRLEGFELLLIPTLLAF